MTSPDRRPDISVIIPTHNRPASLLRLLHALRDGAFPVERFEAIIVADGCSDDTVEIARREPLPFALRVLEQTPGQGPGIARNLGASSAAGELLVFLDDDIEPGPRLLEEHLRAHARAGVPAVGIGPPLPIRPSRADLGTIAAWAWWEGQFAEMRRPGHRFSYNEVFSGNLSIPAALFQAVGAFDPRFSECHEDSELGLRLIQAGARVLFVPEAGGWHHELRDHQRLIRRKRAEGRADVRLAEVHPEIWPSLRISWAELNLWHPLGLLRRTALAAPPLADLLIAGLTGCLPLLEALRLRGSWRKVQAGVMYGWYWRGVGDVVGSRRTLAELARACSIQTPEPETPLDLDLAAGLDHAERRIAEASPDSVYVRLGEIEVGLIPARAGAEPLRAEHLRQCLASEMPHSLLSAMTTLSAAAHPRAPRLRAPQPLGAPVAGTVRLPPVSVVIAAWNAESTLAEALGSLLAQTRTDWEAIVVDDGSTDDTAAIAERYAARDPRIRVLRQEHRGPGSARNLGLVAARNEWVLFFDADDWLLPTALVSLGRVAALGKADAVHAGWVRVTALGEIREAEFAPAVEDLFSRFAEHCVFAISCCLFQRSAVDRIGMFDPSLRTCEDWDFWQRLARSGVRFARVDEKVVKYRMRLRSGATATERLLTDGLAVIGRGHAADPRVSNPGHPEGEPRPQLATARLRFGAWVAGMLIARGEPTGVVLNALRGDSAPGLNPSDVASNLFRAAPLALAEGVNGWDQLWPRVVGEVEAFLQALERQSGAWRLASRTMCALERLTLDGSEAERPLTRGRTFAVDVEVTRPIEALHVSPDVERVHCRVLAEGEALGSLVLPVGDGLVSARVLADAIASRLAWPILGRFFHATRYTELEFVREPAGVSVCLAGVPLAPPIPDSAAVLADQLHNHIGWTLFLREVWGLPGATAGSFYEATGSGEAESGRNVGTSWPVVEIGTDLPHFRVGGIETRVEVRAGGVPLGRIVVPCEDGVVTPSRLRAAITTETGLELAQVLVREALLGQPFRGLGLRARLAALAARSATSSPSPRLPDIIPPSASSRMAPGWEDVVSRVAQDGTVTLIVARHAPGMVNVPADRRASLPSALVPDLLEFAGVNRPPMIRLAGSPESSGRVEYAPELLWEREVDSSPSGVEGEKGSGQEPGKNRYHDRHHFESLFASGDDPWSYETPYEQLKYQQTLALIPQGRIGQALELACAEGRFTRLLAPRVEELIATDLSEIALERARGKNVARNVRFQRLDLARDEFPDQCDLIVCSEVLYYLESVDALRSIGEKFARSLSRSGYLVLAHANVLVDDPDKPGFDWPHEYGARVIGETLATVPSLRFLKEVSNDLYRIQLFQRREMPPEAPVTNRPEAEERVPYHLPAPHAAGLLRWAGGRPSPSGAPAGADTLPILMYHSVACDGPDATARYRVTPEAFEAQLHYLREAGFASVTIHEWLRAVRLRRRLPLRSVLLTFDDGYQDFAENAWPLLRRYGFGALVFLVTDLVGRTSEWDRALGPPVPLMNWDEARRLAAEGVEFGSHSASHRPMTGLNATDLVREALESRSRLERELGRSAVTIAYPHGDSDPAVEHLVGACGFEAAFTCRIGRAGFRDAPLDLPRIEVAGHDDFSTFIAKLGD